jgi:hypothetical protein
MMHDNGLCTSNKKWIKTKMKTLIHFNSKGNEVITWRSFNVWSCLFFNNHWSCMCCCHQCSLHHIYANWINTNNIHQSLEVVFGEKDIHLSLGVAREKVKDLPLNKGFVFQNNSCDSILKCIMNYYMFTPTWALK